MTRWRCVRTGDLQHHGIKGQKWGQRRYQNKDGSLTPAGKKRYSDATWDGPLPTLRELGKMQKEDPEKYAKYQAYSKQSGLEDSLKKLDKEQKKQLKEHAKQAEKEHKQAHKKEKGADDLASTVNNAKKVYDTVSPALRKAAEAKAEKEKIEANKKIKDDLSKMSDAELREIVNRMNMEERYTQVMQSRQSQVANGKMEVDKVLNGIGTAITLASTAIGIYSQLKALQK